MDGFGEESNWNLYLTAWQGMCRPAALLEFLRGYVIDYASARMVLRARKVNDCRYSCCFIVGWYALELTVQALMMDGLE